MTLNNGIGILKTVSCLFVVITLTGCMSIGLIFGKSNESTTISVGQVADAFSRMLAYDKVAILPSKLTSSHRTTDSSIDSTQESEDQENALYRAVTMQKNYSIDILDIDKVKQLFADKLDSDGTETVTSLINSEICLLLNTDAIILSELEIENFSEVPKNGQFRQVGQLSLTVYDCEKEREVWEFDHELMQHLTDPSQTFIQKLLQVAVDALPFEKLN